MNNEIVNDLFAFVVVLYSLIYLSLKAVEVFAGDCDDGIFDPEYDRIHSEINENPEILVTAFECKT